MSHLIRVGEPSPTEFLVVGSSLELSIILGDEDVQCRVTLLGWKVGDYLITELPSSLGESMDGLVGLRCNVRYVFAGKLVEYESEVRGGQLGPMALLFLAFPSHVEHILLRKHPRIYLSQPVCLVPESTEGVGRSLQTPVCGAFDDLSAAGCRLVLTDTTFILEPQGRVKMDFELPGVGHVTNLTGRVLYVRMEPARILVGIEFEFRRAEFIEFRGWGGTVKKAIEQFVAQRQVTWTPNEPSPPVPI
jgi:hypothetical protein